MLLLLLNSQTIEPVEILGGYGGPKRNYRRRDDDELAILMLLN